MEVKSCSSSWPEWVVQGLVARDAGTVPCMQGPNHNKSRHSSIIMGNIQHISNHYHGLRVLQIRKIALLAQAH